MDRTGIEEEQPGLSRRFWSRLREPYPDPDHHRGLTKRLNPRSGEHVQRVVPKHLAVYYPVPLAVAASVVALVLVCLHWNVATQVLFVVSLIVVAVTLFRAVVEWRDVFVLTNWRVVRLSGFLTTRVATMPINRILDMTMTRTPLGRVLGYGHFVFESAAQEQGLREIKFVPNILAVDHQINDAVHQESRRREKLSARAAAGSSTAPTVGPITEPTTDIETTDPLPGV